MFTKTLVLYFFIPKLLHNIKVVCYKFIFIVFLINGNDITPLLMFDMQIELFLGFLSILFSTKN